MAERRMFAKTIVLSDAFLDMPLGSRALYMTLSMVADDDGFVNSPKSVMRQCGATEDDLKVLITKKFVIPFDSGVIVIKHWRINNYLRNDRYQETKYLEEKSQLIIDEKGAYKVGIPESGIPRLDKVSIGKDSIDNYNHKRKKSKYGQYQNVLLTDGELTKLKENYSNYVELITFLDEYIEMKGYKAKSHYLAIKKWVVDAVEREKSKKQPDFTLKRQCTENEIEEIRKKIGL